MERQIELAIQQALSLARARGAELAAVTLRASHNAEALIEAAARVLKRLEAELVEVRVESGHGALELVSIELHPPSRR